MEDCRAAFEHLSIPDDHNNHSFTMPPQSNSHFSTMPTELLLQVIANVPFDPATLLNLSLVCRDFHATIHASKPELYYSIITSQFPLAHKLHGHISKYTSDNIVRIARVSNSIEVLTNALMENKIVKTLNPEPDGRRKSLELIKIGLLVVDRLKITHLDPCSEIEATIALGVLPVEVLMMIRLVAVVLWNCFLVSGITTRRPSMHEAMILPKATEAIEQLLISSGVDVACDMGRALLQSTGHSSEDDRRIEELFDQALRQVKETPDFVSAFASRTINTMFPGFTALPHPVPKPAPWAVVSTSTLLLHLWKAYAIFELDSEGILACPESLYTKYARQCEHDPNTTYPVNLPPAIAGMVPPPVLPLLRGIGLDWIRFVDDKILENVSSLCRWTAKKSTYLASLGTELEKSDKVMALLKPAVEKMLEDELPLPHIAFFQLREIIEHLKAPRSS